MNTELLTTPFVASWFPRARPGDVHDPDPGRRAAAWAHWALTAMTAMTGHANRPYTALLLPGQFYTANKSEPAVRPHLEIPAGVFARPDPQFPDRLAQAGNALHFPWWVFPEVLAVKRAVVPWKTTDIGALCDLLTTRRVALIDALAPLSAAAQEQWSKVEALHVATPDELARTATRPFTTDEIHDYLPAAQDLNLEVHFDQKLAQSSGSWAARRIGVWAIQGKHDGAQFSLGVLTPRLTRSSLFTDPMFTPPQESTSALLVRGLMLRRLLNEHLGVRVGQPVADAPAPRGAGPRLRAVVARVGDKQPEASAASAAYFLESYPDEDNAWAALTQWAQAPVPNSSSPRAVLTVTQETHRRAHRSCLRALRRAEQPDRDDIDALLPLAWDHRNRVVRVTFARPPKSPGDQD